MERVTYKYDKIARENKVIVVTCCGFDSIPADLGVLRVQEQFMELKNDADLTVQSFLSFKTGPSGYCGHATTWECAVLGISNQASFSKWRKNIADSSIQPKNIEKPKKGWFTNPHVPGYCYLFPGSDASVVRRSQSYLSRTFGTLPVVSYGAYFTVESWLSKIFITIAGVFLTLFSKFSVGRWFLLQVSFWGLKYNIFQL